MRNLTSAAWIKLKGALFLLLGLLCATLLLLERSSVADALLLVVAVWSFCRFYYFAFYVMEKYVDAEYRYSGLLDFARYMIAGKRVQRQNLERKVKDALLKGRGCAVQVPKNIR